MGKYYHLHESDSDPDDPPGVPSISYKAALEIPEALRPFPKNPTLIRKASILHREQQDIGSPQDIARREQHQTSITGF